MTDKNRVIAHVVGARPNFVKAAPLIKAINSTGIKQVLIHTGQHYSKNLSDDFFEVLNIPEPDYHLSIGSGTHATQTAAVLEKIEPILSKVNPDIVVVYGDVNSTVAACLAAAKLQIKTAHIESGLRSFDKQMPEEINRLIVDHICDYCFVTEPSGLINLENDGIEKDRMFFVGNTMIDTLKSAVEKVTCFDEDEFALLTCHRPSNVDNKEGLTKILEACKLSPIKVVFPVHPRTMQKMDEYGLLKYFSDLENLVMCDPMSYTEFLGRMKNAKFVLTDSGGIQEETTALLVPCLTLRENTERPVTIDIGTNVLIKDLRHLKEQIDKICCDDFKKGDIPKFWDGKASLRITEIIERILI